jgi:calcium/calmodulin-dependent protein kinase I
VSINYISVNRDLKPENLLLTTKDDSADLKVADFGFATEVQGFSETKKCGTPAYIAPEIIQGKPYGKPIDMWSFGVILYILLGGYPPFHDAHQKKMFQTIIRGEFQFHNEYWSRTSNEAKDLIRRLLTVDMHRRLTVDDALNHPWCGLSPEELRKHVLDANLAELRKFQATKKFRAGVNAVIAVNRMRNYINFSVDDDEEEEGSTK